jgi:hypothetical protein
MSCDQHFPRVSAESRKKHQGLLANINMGDLTRGGRLGWTLPEFLKQGGVP